MKRSIFLVPLLAAFATPAFAQSFNDVIRFSQENQQSTARSVGMGNAMGAVGGDMSTLSSNPAGIGLYRSSEFSISTGLNVPITRSTYLGKRNNDFTIRGSFGGTGGVFSFHSGLEKENGLLALNFGLAFNKLQDYTQRSTVQANNTTSSYLDALAEQANALGLTPDNFKGGDEAFGRNNWEILSAWRAYLLEPEGPRDAQGKITKFDHFVTPLANGEAVRQTQRFASRGHLSEFDMSAGFNISNVFYGGATLGIQVLDYRHDRKYTEESLMQKDYGFSSMSYMESTQISGYGVNLKLGVIYRPIDFFRVGFSFHTPTAMQVESKGTLNVEAHFLDGKMRNTKSKSPEGRTSYSMTTPMRLQGSAAITFGHVAMLAAEYTYSLYPLASLGTGTDYETANDVIRNQLRPTHGVGVGAELVARQVAFRLGGGFQTSPYTEKLFDPYGQRYYFSAGLGYSGAHFSADVAYRQMVQRGEYALYTFKNTDYQVDRRIASNLILATLAFRF